MDAVNSDEALAGSQERATGDLPLLRRKHVLMGMLASGFAIVGAAQTPTATAGTIKAVPKAIQPTVVPRWTPATAYPRGQQVISPLNDVVSAKVAHTSSASYVTDAGKWNLSTTFDAEYARQLTATPATTAADLTAWLAIPFNGWKRLAGAATIHAPIVIPSNTYLDATGATISLAEGSDCWMVRNSAVNPLRSGSADAVVTAGSTTVTTATGAFTSADVGRVLAVAFKNEATRGVNGYGQILTVDSRTSVTIDTAPLFTESGGVARVYARDSNIHVRGGTWDKGTNAGVGVLSNAFHLRRIDIGSITEGTFNSDSVGVGTGYMIAPADVSDFRLENLTFNCNKDAVHFLGPASNIKVKNIHGHSGGDDVVAFTTTDYGGYNDAHGDFSNLVVSDVVGSPTSRVIRMVLLATSCSGYADGHSINGAQLTNVKDQGGSSYGIATWIQSNDANSRVDNLKISNAECAVNLHHVAHGRVTIDGVTGPVAVSRMNSNYPGVTEAHLDDLTIRDSTGMLTFTDAATTIDKLRITGGVVPHLALGCGSIASVLVDWVTVLGAASYMLSVGGGCQVGAITLDHVKAATTYAAGLGVIAENSRVGALTFTDCRISATTTAHPLVCVHSGSTMGTLTLARSEISTLAGVLLNSSASQITVLLTDLTARGCERITEGGGGALVKYLNVQFTGVHAWVCPFYANGPMSLTGSGFSSTVVTVDFDRTASNLIHVTDPHLRGDLSILAKANGDAAYNTNADLACGLGPAICDGAGWKNTYSAAVC